MTVTAAELGGVYLVRARHTLPAGEPVPVCTHVCCDPVLTVTLRLVILQVITLRPQESSYVTSTRGPSIRALTAVS